MKPIELTNWMTGNKWLKINNGGNTSLCKNRDKECVIAYYKEGVVTYMIIKTIKEYKIYAIAEFEKNFHGEELNKSYINVFEWIILDRKEFGNFRKSSIVKALTA